MPQLSQTVHNSISPNYAIRSPLGGAQTRDDFPSRPFRKFARIAEDYRGRPKTFRPVYGNILVHSTYVGTKVVANKTMLVSTL